MPVYLDYAATTPVCPEAAQAAYEVLTGNFGNPSSGYSLGRQSAAALKSWRADVAAAVGCQPGELVFTSCGTEGDNWALRAAARAMRRRGNHIITTAVEHAAVLETARFLEGEGFRFTYLKPDSTGHIDPENFRAALCDDTIAVSMMLVNNETGAVFPVAQCAKIAKAHSRDILFHTDAVQGFCHIPFTPKELGVDLLTVSGHKIGAPKGIGALYIRKEIQNRIKPLLFGGLQEDGRRPGTEPTAQIAAFAAACRAMKSQGAAAMERTRTVKEYALARMQELVPGLKVISCGDAPHICAISLPGYPSQMVMNDLDSRGICVSNGSACHKGKPSHVFAALELPSDVLKGVLRISFSPASTQADADALAEALTAITQERMTMMK